MLVEAIHKIAHHRGSLSRDEARAVMGELLGFERLTVKSALTVPLFPSVTLTLPIVMAGTGSSLRTVPCPTL